MADVFNVAAYILKKKGPMTAMKLEKLVYYSQAWSLVWDERPLFSARIEAWANGPVVPKLYRWHRGQFNLRGCSEGDPSNLTNDQRETIDGVLRFYGDKPSMSLSELTHRERPWREARAGLRPGERGNREITLDSMARYYESISN